MWLDRLNVWLLCALLALAPAAANASQNALSSPSTGTVSGLQLTNNYNNALDSLNTCNSGSTAPTNQLSGVPSLGNCWLNTTASPYPRSYYDGANWLVPFWLDSVNHYIDVKIGGGVTTVASASTVDLCATANAPQAVIEITGTTTINSFGSTCNPGHVKILNFTGILALTNSASLVLPGGANITTAAGDQAVLYPLSTGNWQILAYTPASGQAIVNDLSSGLCSAQLTWSPAIPASGKYVYAFGQAISRASFPAALAACTITQSVSATNGSPVLTGFSDTTQIAAGAAIEGSFVPAGTTIISCTSTTCTLSANASSSAAGSVTIFPYGNGCGIGTSCSSPSTTFNVPDCRDVVLAGRGNMGGTPRSDSYQLSSTYFGASPNALGVFGGGQSTQLAASNVPTITSTNPSTIGLSVSSSVGNVLTGSGIFGGVSGSSGSGLVSTSLTSGTLASTGSLASNAVSVTSNNTGGASPTAFSRVQPSQTANCMVRVIARLMPSYRFAANDNFIDSSLAMMERRRRTA